MTEVIEDLIQLTLTKDEALILCSITSLGIETLAMDAKAAKITMDILEVVLETYPQAALTLAKKMVTLISVTR